MVSDFAPEFDVGPLSWVQGEIDQALANGLEALGRFAAAPGDGTALKHARTHVHQVAGAIQMVGLDAVVAYTDELERQLARLEEPGVADTAAACAAIDRAGRKLRVFLGELKNGAPLVALRLYPEYEAMQKLRGVPSPAPTDLFFPDLSPRGPKSLAVPAATSDQLAGRIARLRRIFQQGLLLLLRGDRAGAKAMREAVAGIETATAQPNLRAFWWTVGAFLDALAAKGLDPGLGVKQLAGRIDLQIRRLAEGSTNIADHLRREVLYWVAISAPVVPSVWEVQRAFKLSGLIPSAAELSDDVLRLDPLLREAREQIAVAKEAWLKLTPGRGENLPKLRQAMTAVREAADEIGNPALSRLAASLVTLLDRMPPGTVPEPIAMEYATALLLTESALANYASLTPEFHKQVDLMLARLDAVADGRPVSAAAAPLLDEMSKRAHERILLAQVCREIQANLRRMEQILDSFFRDQEKRADLALLAKDSAQIRGALRMLGLDQADRLLGLCEEQIRAFANPDTVIGNDGLELLAESLSSLGFYIEAVEQQRPGRERLIAPLLAARLGEAPTKPVEAQDRSAEAALKEVREALPALVAEVRQAPADEIARQMLNAKLRVLLDDAELAGDAGLVRQADAALRELATGGALGLTGAVSAIAEAAAPMPLPSISAETQRLLASDETALDAEFLDIYLTEAGEVLDAVAENRATLEHNLGARDALRTVRRGFHTLKGSGRMVGLSELGELAYDVEKIHNRLLDEDHAVTPAVVAMIGVAEKSFRDWVAVLRNTGRVRPDATDLRAAIQVVETQLPGGQHVVVQPPRAEPATEQAAPEPVALEPVALEPMVLEPMAPEPMAPESIVLGPAVPEPALPPLSAPVAIELAEVGFDAATAPHVEIVEEATEPEEAVVDEVLAVAPETTFPALAGEHPSTASTEAPAAVSPALGAAPEYEPEPEPEPQVEPEPEVVPQGAAEPELDDIMIGDVRVSSSLLRILVDEADEHLATLRGGLEAMLLDPTVAPSATMVRAGHTLCGIHRTAGLTLVAETARALEQCLLGLQMHQAPMPSSALPVTARAIAGLADLVDRVRSRAAFDDHDRHEAGEIQLSLDALRQETSAGPTPADAESLAARDAAREDEQAPPVPPAPLVPAAPTPRPPATASVPPRVDVHAVTELLQTSAPHIGPVAASADSAVAPELVPEAVQAKAAAHTVPAPADADALQGVRDDVDAQVLPIFLDEATELMPAAGEALRAWRRRPDDGESAHRLRRTLHTFKGSARMAGAMRLGALTHRMESRLPEGEAPSEPVQRLFDALDVDLDHIAFVLDALRRGQTNVPLPGTAGAAQQTMPEPPAATVPISIAATPPGAVPPVEAGSQAAALLPLVPRTLSPPAVPAATRDDAIEAETGQRALLRVRADMVDRLVNEAGEVAITRARIDGELRQLKANLLELTGSVIRLRAQVREIEIQGESQIQSRMSQFAQTAGAMEGFDPLEFDRYTRFQELTRSLAEGVNDVATVQQALLKNLDDADAALLAQARLSREMQQQLFSIRTVAFGSVSERLYRILRQTAKELDKRVNLEISGAQVELDRSVLEKLGGPLEHLLRNALDHGIESRAARAAAGKSETGELTLTARQVGNEIAIELVDDGAGLDLEAIRAKAVAQGRIAADAAPTVAQLIECIFHAGFSTATRVTPVSGRGIGMDVVRSEVAALGGRVEVTTTPGRGTAFHLYLPLTLAVAQAVLVRAAGRLWALPAPMVEQVQQIKPEALVDLYVARAVEWQGRSYPFHYLPRLLGESQHNPETSRHNSVLLLRTGQSTAAVHVDEMIGNQEVVVKNIGPQLARVSGIAGATVLGTGEIVLIINPVQLAQRADVPWFDPNAPDQLVASYASPAPRRAMAAPLVMIVDDSLTVRKITSRLLVREGFGVITAKDGAEALQLLEASTPAVILLDIEMPRMDGFEFTKTIKRDPVKSHIPIIMITSRTAEKHRNRAKELGVDLYLGKPFQEEELLRNLREMLAIAS